MSSPSAAGSPGAWVAEARLYWDRFWFEPKPPTSLALFRILFGSFLLFYWLARAPYVPFLYTARGLYFPMYSAPEDGFLGVRGVRTLLGALMQPAPEWLTWILYGGLVLALAMFTLGVFSRRACLAYLVLSVYFHHVQVYQQNTLFDRLFLQMAVLMCLARSDEVLSLRRFYLERFRGSAPPSAPLVPFWPARLITVQVALVYFGTGFHKTFSPAWQGGEMLYYNFIGIWGSPLAFSIARLELPMEVYAVFVYLTIAFELTAPFGLFSRRAQPWYFLAGMAFHVSIAATLQIWQFLVMPAAYVLFVDAFTVERAFDRLLLKTGGPRD